MVSISSRLVKWASTLHKTRGDEARSPELGASRFDRGSKV